MELCSARMWLLTLWHQVTRRHLGSAHSRPISVCGLPQHRSALEERQTRTESAQMLASLLCKTLDTAIKSFDARQRQQGQSYSLLTRRSCTDSADSVLPCQWVSGGRSARSAWTTVGVHAEDLAVAANRDRAARPSCSRRTATRASVS